MKEIFLQQGTPEWHEFRKNHIGASDAPVILGLSPWKKEKELWIEKTSGCKKEFFSNEHIERGKRLEPFALEKFNKEMGCNCVPSVFVHDEIDYMSASLDGWDDEMKIAVEIKCPTKKSHNASRKAIPDAYMAQMQHQFEVMSSKKNASDIKQMFYFSYVSDSEFFCEEIFRRKNQINQILKKEAIFWRCMLEKTPPETEKEKRRKNMVNMGFDWWKIAKDIEDLQLARKEYEGMVKGLKEAESTALERLFEMSKGMPAYSEGYELQVQERKGMVDYKQIPELKEVDLEKYRKETKAIPKLVNVEGKEGQA